MESVQEMMTSTKAISFFTLQRNGANRVTLPLIAKFNTRTCERYGVVKLSLKIAFAPNKSCARWRGSGLELRGNGSVYERAQFCNEKLWLEADLTGCFLTLSCSLFALPFFLSFPRLPFFLFCFSIFPFLVVLFFIY